MAPEERARQLVNGKDWLLQLPDAVTETGDALTIEIVSEPLLEQLIADAIREAVRAEREACANVALEVARQFGGRMEEIGWENASLFNTLTRQVAACERVAGRIRKREDD